MTTHLEKVLKSTSRLQLLKVKEYEPLKVKCKNFNNEEEVKPFQEGKLETIKK